MKTRLCLVLGITAVLGLLACNEDKIISDTQLVNSISVTVQDFLDADPVTRAVYNVDGTGFHFTWSAGDIVGVYPVGGDQVAFPISNGVGTQTAKFDGGAWALRSSYSYAAYYPFASGNYEVNETSIPVNYLGQVQDGNGSLDCLDNYDYQASVATHPDDDGNVNIALKHLGCFARFQFKMPVADTLKSITLTSNNTYFITSGKYDLTKDSIYVIPDSTSSAFSISLLNTVITDEDKVLTVYVMLAPSDLSDSEIRISIEGTQYKSFITSVSGKNMIAGKAYSYRATIQSGIDINGSYVFWNEEGQEQGPEYVDLGLSVNWATFNVGASKPEEYGDYFAWGEVEPYYEAGYAQVNPETHWKSDKLDGYSWTSYKFCIEGNYYEDVKFSKYNKTYTLGEEVENIVLDPEDDVAHVMWGNDWRMPTRAEFDEIFYYCKWTNIIQNGVNGYLVTSKKAGYEDRSIFLPASGYRLGKNLYSFGDKGYYWLSSLNTIPYESVSFYFGLNNNGWDTSLRECGYSVRPVCPNEKTVASIELSRTEVSLIVGKSIQIKATPKNSGDCSWNRNL